MMRVAIVSDIHLGRGDRTDRFGHDPATFHRFLDHVEGQADRVVLLGDIVDTHHGRVPLAFAREFRLVIATHPGLAERLLGGRYEVVAGNHDDCLAGRPGVHRELLLTHGRRRALLLHGHQFDRLIAASPTLCALANFAGGMAQRHGFKRALALLDWLDDKANGFTVDRGELYRRKALKLAAQRGVDFIVLGHTHQQSLAQADGITYLNSGACVDGRCEYGILDLATGRASPETWVP